MSMTEEEVIASVSTRWRREGLGRKRPVGWYILKIQNTYHEIFLGNFERNKIVSPRMLQILAYVWSNIHSYGASDIPSSSSIMLKGSQLTLYPLEISGVTWDKLVVTDYFMMTATYINDLASMWEPNPATFWSDESATIARYLFETCLQYATRFGIAEDITP
jgi:hypothetical protein